MLNEFSKKESPIQGLAGFGGGALSKSILSSAVTKTYVDDLFSVNLYEGNNSARTITHNIDLAGEGGMIWMKNRESTTQHAIWASELLGSSSQSWGQYVSSNSDGVGGSYSSGNTSYPQVTSTSHTTGWYNIDGNEIVNWTFRKAKGFLDIVTFDGTGSAQNIPHNLGSVPGMIWIKKTNDTGNWIIYHRSVGATKYMSWPGGGQPFDGADAFNDTEPTSTQFSLGDNSHVNQNTKKYIAFIFAHDIQSFGDNGDESIIKCGTYEGNGNTQTIDIGFEPQFYMWKCIDESEAFSMIDMMSGWPNHKDDAWSLKPNSTSAQNNYGGTVTPAPNGVYLADGDVKINQNSRTYIYMAIRRPHKPVTVGTDVLDIVARNGSGSAVTVSSNVTVDLAIVKHRNASNAMVWLTRLMGNQGLESTDVVQQSTNVLGTSVFAFDVQKGIKYTSDGDTNTSGSTYINYFFKRSPGVFDISTFIGTGSAQNIPHNLGAVPDLIIVKRRNANSWWYTYASPLGNTVALAVNRTDLQSDDTSYWNDTTPTSTQFTVGDNSDTNGSGAPHVAYLFANKDGVCKIGKYTGTGNDITIDCGFDPRFIIIKTAIGSQGDGWYVVDTVRGINSGNDPWVRLNQAYQEVSSNDIVDTTSDGFIVQAGGGSRVNDADGREYLFIAMA